MRIRFIYFYICLFLLAGLLVTSAEAYTPQKAGPGAGSNLRWRSKKIVVSISSTIPESLNGSVSRIDFENAIRESFFAWSRETGIEFSFKVVATSNLSDKSSGGDGVSLVTIAPTTDNLLLFGEKDTNKSAVTRLFFDPEGYILEADILLNPTARFTNDGSRGSFDLRSTLMHETGHFLGLGHSNVVGSTMHRHQGKNGTFALPATYSRTLSDDDKAGIRALYGPPAGREKEFGSIEGQLEGLNPESFPSRPHVWIESVNNGNVVAGIGVDSDGRFALNSIPADGYRIYAALENGKVLSGGGNIVVQAGQVSAVDVRVEGLEYNSGYSGVFGFNGQLSDLAVPVEKGHTYSFIYGSKGLNPNEIRIISTSPGVFVDSRSITHLYTNGDTVVVGFELYVSSTAAAGDYSLRVFEGDQLKSHLPGVVTIDEVQNPWYSASF